MTAAIIEQDEKRDFYVVYNDETLADLPGFLRSISYNTVREQVRDKKDRLCIALVMDYNQMSTHSNRQQRAAFITCSHKALHKRAIRLARMLAIGEGNRTPRRKISKPEVVIISSRRKKQND